MQPSMEALQMARMLGDTDPPDYSDLIQQVQTVVPGKSEDTIFDSLHFHNFDVEKTITALLDSDGERLQVLMHAEMHICSCKLSTLRYASRENGHQQGKGERRCRETLT